MKTKKVELKNCEVVANSNQGGKISIPFKIGEKVNVEYTEIIERKLVDNGLGGEKVYKDIVINVKDKKINGKKIKNFVVHLKDKTVFCYETK